jgi:cytochrome c oxidase assembly protein subunit 11
MKSVKNERANRRMMTRLSIFAAAMFGFGFLLVPFYEKICEVTGVNSLIKQAVAVENTQIDTSRWVTLEFDSNAHGLEWDFKPVQRSVRVHPGEMIQIEYDVRNNGEKAVVGQAIPSYGPKHAAPYVKKMECFCFKQQPLQAGESKRMPVQFVIDSTLPADVNTITLSYTFFEVKGAAIPKAGGQG